MEKESRKSKKLNWTLERRQYFVEVKKALIDLPKLFLINDSNEIKVVPMLLIKLSGDMFAKW